MKQLTPHILMSTPSEMFWDKVPLPTLDANCWLNGFRFSQVGIFRYCHAVKGTSQQVNVASPSCHLYTPICCHVQWKITIIDIIPNCLNADFRLVWFDILSGTYWNASHNESTCCNRFHIASKSVLATQFFGIPYKTVKKSRKTSNLYRK